MFVHHRLCQKKSCMCVHHRLCLDLRCRFLPSSLSLYTSLSFISLPVRLPLLHLSLCRSAFSLPSLIALSVQLPPKRLPILWLISLEQTAKVRLPFLAVIISLKKRPPCLARWTAT